MSDQIRVGKYVGTVLPDKAPPNPRTEWDNLSVMACWHPRYNLGDKQLPFDPEVIRNYVKERKRAGDVILPLYLYDHSGITISTKPFSCKWDSGQVGFVSISREVGQREFGRLWRKLAAENIEVEVETYDLYLTGDVWGYEVTNTEDEEEVDSLWGLYGHKYAMQELETFMKTLPQSTHEST